MLFLGVRAGYPPGEQGLPFSAVTGMLCFRLLIVHLGHYPPAFDYDTKLHA
jgi:hypothetical protein